MKKWLQDNLSKVKQALFKTKSVIDSEKEIETDNQIEVNDELFESLTERFIKADVGISLSEDITNNLKKHIKEKEIKKADLSTAVKTTIKQILGNKINAVKSEADNSEKKIYLIVGVNGSGKTTSIGKLAKKFKDNDFKVLIVAGDTFRAAAGEQLEIWANRTGVEIFSPQEIKKPDAVVYAAIEKAKKENFDLLLIDTAGRLQTQKNLMDELTKIDAVVEKQIKTCHGMSQQYKKLIVLDATIGQNAIVQAELFSKAINLNGIILSKLDSSAKGGVVLNIMNKLSLPVKFIGTGEQIDDIADFSLDEYLDGLLS